jgi:hypothetical protein
LLGERSLRLSPNSSPGAQLVFPITGRQYAVQASLDLQPNNWTNFSGNPFPGNGKDVVITDSDGFKPKRFYRVKESQ